MRPILVSFLAIALNTLLLMSCRTSSTQLKSELAQASNDPVLFDDTFFFGIATAPAHAEDGLQDMWLDFARRQPNPGVKAWKNAGYPDLRLKFFTDYATEINLAKELGSQVYRMGVDWGRLVPEKPIDTCPKSATPCYAVNLDEAAVQRYLEILRYVRAQGMTPILTLYHHSLPKWLQEARVDRRGKKNTGGWTNPDAIDLFDAFAQAIVPRFQDEVDTWIIFNEPAVFASLAYSAGIWPPAQGINVLSILDLGFFKGDFVKAVDYMVEAHKRVYTSIKRLDTKATGDRFTTGPAQVGIAHNVGYYTSGDRAGAAIANLFRENINYKFIDGVIDSLDFLGLNYYGEEHIRSTSGLAPRKDREYSESGRGVNPNGFYESLKSFHERYLKGKRSIPIYITENGISDATDILRPAYLLEHLAALDAARKEGVPVQGYIFWTLSDNWEWADGYCPKFGIVEVDRSTPELRRIKRPSFELYADIIRHHGFPQSVRDQAWQAVRSRVGQLRPFCRSPDGQNSLDVPEQRPIVDQDWRFAIPSQALKNQ